MSLQATFSGEKKTSEEKKGDKKMEKEKKKMNCGHVKRLRKKKIFGHDDFVRKKESLKEGENEKQEEKYRI